MKFDTVIRNGTVYDGSGLPEFVADVGIVGDRIEMLGNLAEAKAAEVIDAAGMAVCPGFIDPHTHCHVNVERNEFHHDNLLRQGITTVVAGNCGKSGWPVGEHLDRVDEIGFKTNYATLVGHHTVRWQLIDVNDRRFATQDELRRMADLVRRGIEEGAFGLTIGYAQAHEPFDELLAVARPAAEAGTIVASHIRSENSALIRAVAELIEIAQYTGVRIQISHLKTDRPANWNKLDSVLYLIDDAVRRGIEVAADRYPYCAWHGGSTNTMPLWCHLEAKQRGGKQRLKDPDIIDQVRAAIEEMVGSFGGPDKLLFTGFLQPDPEVDGKTLTQLMRNWNMSLFDTALELERRSDEHDLICSIGFTMNEDNLRRILQHPRIMIGTDAALIGFGRGATHPRMYGSFPRVLGQFVRDEELMPLPEAIRKMTSLPANWFRLPDRGVLHAGAFADIVVFNPHTLRDNTTFANAHQYPTGIEWVFVNGSAAVRSGETAPEHFGRALRRK